VDNFRCCWPSLVPEAGDGFIARQGSRARGQAMDQRDSHDLVRSTGAIRFERARRLKDGGYCLVAHHAGFDQPIRFTFTPGDPQGWQITAWVATQTEFDDDTWSFPHLEATALDGQPALEDVLRRIAPIAAADPRTLSAWVYEISAALARVLRTLTVYDSVGCAWRRAA